MVRCLANPVIALPQFCAHGESHKERFDKLIGLINSQRCQPDEFAFACRVPERVLSRISATCSNMNRHVRLENRRIVSMCEIIDDSLKEAACRLGRDKPVRNDGLPGHKTAKGSGSTPLLQLYDVAFRISRINHAKQSNAVYFCRGDFSHYSPAGCDYCLQRFIHVFHRECNVAESALVSSRQSAFDQLIV